MLLILVYVSQFLYHYLKECHCSPFSVPSGPPRDLQVFATGSSMIFLSWEPPLLEQQNGIIRQYHISLVSGQSTVTTTSMNTNVTISGLRPFTTYQCSVAALTISAGPVSGTIPVTTPEDGMLHYCWSTAVSLKPQAFLMQILSRSIGKKLGRLRDKIWAGLRLYSSS